jgi:hypothetical protein
MRSSRTQRGEPVESERAMFDRRRVEVGLEKPDLRGTAGGETVAVEELETVEAGEEEGVMGRRGIDLAEG